MNPDENPWLAAAPEPPSQEPEFWSQFARPPVKAGTRPVLHLLLFLATLATTIATGALLSGVNPITDPGLLYKGLPFSFALLLILGSHEMGHYLMARHHRLDVTLPYFIPGPPVPPGPGTFGAVIRIRSPIQDKRALLDVGCSGPLIGVAVSIPVILIGLMLSSTAVLDKSPDTVIFGEPLLFKLLSWLVFGSLPADQVILIHPVAYAGWLGLFVTALNLLPVGQLDGGHVIYAMFPEYHRYISWICLGLLLVFGLVAWPGWLLWVVLIIFIIGWRHPAPYHNWVPLDRRRWVLGIITILVFILTFSPAPFSLG